MSQDEIISQLLQTLIKVRSCILKTHFELALLVPMSSVWRDTEFTIECIDKALNELDPKLKQLYINEVSKSSSSL